jgi:hypothetical protein
MNPIAERSARTYVRLDPVAGGRMGSNLERSGCVNKRMNPSAETGAWVYTRLNPIVGKRTGPSAERNAWLCECMGL